MSEGPRVARVGRVTLHEYDPAGDRLCEDVADGLCGPRKRLPPKYFYDERGARLFDRITMLDAYYPTRTELGILERNIHEIAACIGPECRLVEFGSGSGIKTSLLLEHLDDPVAYVPIDVARAQLVDFAAATAERFPELEVAAVWADYTSAFELPQPRRPARRTVAFFPGSTIGNFEPGEAAAFLAHVARLCGADGRMLIGIDLKKDSSIIERAYNDPEGVTAAFNLNLLRRINRECGSSFDVDAFRHDAFFDEEHGRVEMRLVSERRQVVAIPCEGQMLDATFEEGEAITTEYSYKFDPAEFARMAEGAGWAVERGWTDERDWFGVYMLRRA